ncbi:MULTISPECIES: multidrug efflux SMR transporter [unclassified Bacillus cereus group]|uniref:DMT family transporter n=1 Tax=unclassified Bacillus cereus group TaxID=2750818 RepID=UPI001F5A0D46|nr:MULTISPECIES: multidrug efflux SMR transporter [unclassified Bacillus cereus group]
MAWIYVILAGIIEIFWVIGLKHAEAPLEWLGVALIIVMSFILLFKAYKDLPVGTVYAVFTGIGAGGIVLTEIFIFGEPVSIVKILFIALIFVGVIGLKQVTGEEKKEKEAA